MITLHSFFLMEHLGGKGEKEKVFNQALFDEVFLDMQHSLREMGVGDLSVGKKVRKMSEIFYGACNGYRQALKEPDSEQEDALGQALQRNILGESAKPDELENLVNYTLKSIEQVKTFSVARIMAGKLEWPELELGDSK